MVLDTHKTGKKLWAQLKNDCLKILFFYFLKTCKMWHQFSPWTLHVFLGGGGVLLFYDYYYYCCCYSYYGITIDEIIVLDVAVVIT